MSRFKLGAHFDDSFKGMAQKEIKDNLESTMYSSEERSYTKNLNEEEVLQKKDQYSEIGIQLSEIAEKKKITMEQFKILEKEPKAIAGELLQAIKYRSEQRYGKLYLIDDQEEGMMYIFDETGVCVDLRPLTKQEKQLKLKTINQDE